MDEPYTITTAFEKFLVRHAAKFHTYNKQIAIDALEKNAYQVRILSIENIPSIFV